MGSSGKDRTDDPWKLSVIGSCSGLGTLINGSLVPLMELTGSLFWCGPVSLCPEMAVVTCSEDSGETPDEPSVSKTGKGLPGMMPAL